MVTSEFWKDRRVFLTGHTGFKGSWLCLWLNSMGAQVTGYALEPPTSPSLFQLAQVGELVHSVIADVRDLERLQREMVAAAPEIVIHMAAQPLVRDSYRIPVETYATNVMGTVHLLEAVRSISTVRAVVNVTTDKVYENREWIWGYRENEPFGGYDPYSNSKACSELVTAAYRSSYFNPRDYDHHEVAVASARAGNVIGGGDWATDRLVPDIIQAITAGRPVLIRNPHAIRPWQHVLEPLSGYLLLARRLWEEGSRYASGWNFGPDDDDARPVGWLVERLCRSWGEGATFELDRGEHPHEAHYLKLDCSKAKVELGWHPRWGLERALDSIVEWTRLLCAGGDVRQECLRQIEEYRTCEVAL
ncbi:CDP-glucose 4,6-dehydratase [Geobacter argillaceus]|uniref:CDP-glucose 4,6-dehydratase n=1 Tax=Geobacter argillaceus TaxID=345631 RepID=A0A562WQJ8_9BACT|nr:CDP-glucose 4,6-dehydratase [Geobacter argillaceus]TWJ32599.1 CDP-glucose 4,6-dehydratase [Geobacter argillaceus]